MRQGVRLTARDDCVMPFPHRVISLNYDEFCQVVETARTILRAIGRARRVSVSRGSRTVRYIGADTHTLEHTVGHMIID